MPGYRLLSFWLCWLFASALFGQTKIAIIENHGVTSPVIKNIQDSLYSRLGRISGVMHLVYMYADDSLRFDAARSSVRTEVSPDLLMYAWINLFENYEPALNMVRPEGKPPEAHFALSIKAEVRCKFIDVATNTIVHVSSESRQDAIPVSTNLDMVEREGKLTAGNYKNYFPYDPDYMKVNKPREYTAALARMHKDYESRFRNFFMNKREDVIQMIIGAEMNCLYPHPLVSRKVVMENEKAKKIHVPLSREIALPRHVYMEVFSLDTVNGFVIPDDFGPYYVEDYLDGVIILDAVLGSKLKQAGEAFAAGKSLYASFSDRDISCKLGDVREGIRIGIDFGALRIIPFENELARMKDLTLTDLSMTPVVNHLRQRFHLSPLPAGPGALQEGRIQYVLQQSGDKIHLLEPGSGRTMVSYDDNLGLKGFMDEAMELFDREIEVVDITKEKNGKAQKIRLYSPLGFLGDHVLIIHAISGDGVAEIGTCSELGAHHSIAEFNVYKGEDAVYKAITSGQALRFRNKTFRLFGNSFK